MRNFFGRTVDKALKSRGLTKEQLAYKVLPLFLLDLMKTYLRVTTEGMKHVPKKGPYIIIANHSGYMAFDALMLSYQVYLARKRIPRIIAHKLWFINPEIKVHAEKMGLIPATLDNGLRSLEKREALILFPEGEEGNFKPSKYSYRLRRFRRGFVRLALQTGAPVIPAVVVGAEETHITLSQIEWFKDLFGVLIPVPLNVLPLPAKWHIKFLKPIKLKKAPEKADDIQYVTHLARQIRLQLQKELHAELKKRKTVFL